MPARALSKQVMGHRDEGLINERLTPNGTMPSGPICKVSRRQRMPSRRVVRGPDRPPVLTRFFTIFTLASRAKRAYPCAFRERIKRLTEYAEKWHKSCSCSFCRWGHVED